jgi:hypothetical protein
LTGQEITPRQSIRPVNHRPDGRNWKLLECSRVSPKPARRTSPNAVRFNFRHFAMLTVCLLAHLAERQSG